MNIKEDTSISFSIKRTRRSAFEANIFNLARNGIARAPNGGKVESTFEMQPVSSFLHGLRNKTFSWCLHNLVKTTANVLENSRADQWKAETREVSQTLRVFNKAIKARRTCLFLLNKMIIFVLNKKKKNDGRGAYVYFYRKLTSGKLVWAASVFLKK